MKTLTSQIVVQNPWTTIVRDSIRLPGEKTGDYLIVEREAALMIIVLQRQGDETFTYLVRQYRYPVGRALWQFPMGTHEPGTSLVEHARQELRQETGVHAGRLTPVGEYFVDPGLSRQKCIVFISEEVLAVGEQALEETEAGLTVRKVSLAQLDEMLAAGDLADSWGFAARYFIHRYLGG